MFKLLFYLHLYLCFFLFCCEGFRNVDVFMWNNPAAIVFIAAGNTGDSGVSTVGSPATCKNGVTVGASLNAKESWIDAGLDTSKGDFDHTSLGSFSSRGPTFDGRLKPDICSVGKEKLPPLSLSV